MQQVTTSYWALDSIFLKTQIVIKCCLGLATLRGSAPVTQGCPIQELEGKEEEEEVVVAENMAQASVSSATGEFIGQLADFRFYPGMDTLPGSVVRRKTGQVFKSFVCFLHNDV